MVGRKAAVPELILKGGNTHKHTDTHRRRLRSSSEDVTMPVIREETRRSGKIHLIRKARKTASRKTYRWSAMLGIREGSPRATKQTVGLHPLPFFSSQRQQTPSVESVRRLPVPVPHHHPPPAFQGRERCCLRETPAIFLLANTGFTCGGWGGGWWGVGVVQSGPAR